MDALFDDLSPEDRYKERLVRLKPKLDIFFEWAETEQKKVLPKCKYGAAINYAIKQKDKVFNVLIDGRLELDNNLAERTVKPFVIGKTGCFQTHRLVRQQVVSYTVSHKRLC